jgi:hypothetical protein
LRSGGVGRKDNRTADARPKNRDRMKPVSGVNKKRQDIWERKVLTEHRRRMEKNYVP